jgi:hypothetical protein
METGIIMKKSVASSGSNVFGIPSQIKLFLADF